MNSTKSIMRTCLIFILLQIPFVSFASDFSAAGLWWLEGGLGAELSSYDDTGLTVTVDADAPLETNKAAATFWLGETLPTNFELNCEATIVSSEINANNVNFFLHYSDVTDQPLLQTRKTRSDGNYGDYHEMNGYIITWVNDRNYTHGKTKDGGMKSRLRIRRCPGFELLTERLLPEASEPGRSYDIKIRVKDNRLSIAIDGVELLSAINDAPSGMPNGLLGLRTFASKIKWSNLQIEDLAEDVE